MWQERRASGVLRRAAEARTPEARQSKRLGARRVVAGWGATAVKTQGLAHKRHAQAILCGFFSVTASILHSLHRSQVGLALAAAGHARELWVLWVADFVSHHMVPVPCWAGWGGATV